MLQHAFATALRRSAVCVLALPVIDPVVMTKSMKALRRTASTGPVASLATPLRTADADNSAAETPGAPEPRLRRTRSQTSKQRAVGPEEAKTLPLQVISSIAGEVPDKENRPDSSNQAVKPSRSSRAKQPQIAEAEPVAAAVEPDPVDDAPVQRFRSKKKPQSSSAVAAEVESDKPADDDVAAEAPAVGSKRKRNGGAKAGRAQSAPNTANLAAADDSIAPETQADDDVANGKKKAKAPKRITKAQVNDAIRLDANTGMFKAENLLHSLYPHTSAFYIATTTALQNRDAVVPVPSVVDLGQGLPPTLSPPDQPSATPSTQFAAPLLKHSLTHSQFSCVVTYEVAKDTSELPDATAAAAYAATAGSANEAGPSSVTEDPPQLPAAEVAVVEGQMHCPCHDEDDSPLDHGLPKIAADPSFNAPLRTMPWPSVIPNLGYACLNETLRKHDIFTSRDCVQKSFKEKGLPFVSQLALANARDLLPIIHWNHQHGINLFRLSSCILPWMTFYQVEDLPDFEEIRQALFSAGEAARKYGQRLTFHPSEFCKIAGERPEWTTQSIKELEVHSKIFDLMGFEPSHWNKINIHVGGGYGDKDATLDRFAEVVNTRLSPNCRARLTVENDDKGSLYSVRDLLKLHFKCSVPIVFDFHHHKFCTGDMSEKEAFEAAIATWPVDIRPVVHWSEARDDDRPPAHSDYILGPIYLHGHERDVDVMIESKAKELALLRYREMHIRALAAGKACEYGT